jgi:hypothetical protein
MPTRIVFHIGFDSPANKPATVASSQGSITPSPEHVLVAPLVYSTHREVSEISLLCKSLAAEQASFAVGLVASTMPSIGRLSAD